MAEAPAGFGAMKAEKDKFELKLKGVANPGTVTVESCLGGTATGPVLAWIPIGPVALTAFDQ